MWMADQRRVRRVWLALIQQGLKPSHGSIEEEGFDSICHILFYHSTRPSAFNLQPGNFNLNGRKGNGVKSSTPFVYFAALGGESMFGFSPCLSEAVKKTY